MKIKWPPFPWVCFAMCVGVMGTALISPLYALYKTAWQLTNSDVTLIYTAYMVGAFLGLMCLGRLPDKLGFLSVMKTGLVLIGIGTVISMLACNVVILDIGRFMVGVASSMLTTSASVGLVQLAVKNGNLQRAATLTSLLIAFGFGLGPLVGGIMGQVMPHPLRTTYWPPLLLGGLALYALGRIRVEEVQKGRARFSDFLPKLVWPGASVSLVFLMSGLCAFLAFGIFGLYVAMTPLFLQEMLPWHGPFISGTSIALILFLSAGIQLLTGRLPTKWCGFTGLVVLSAGVVFLFGNLWLKSVVVFAVSVVTTAAGHGMSTLAGISMVNKLAETHNRSGMISTYLMIGYLGSMLPLLGLGHMADRWGLPIALTVFCSAMAVVCLVVAVCFVGHPRVK